MQAAQNFTKLAVTLSDAFTVYVPDRRGRGSSGPPGEHYGLKAECEDIGALLTKAGAHSVFGLSSGAIIALEAARTLSAIHKVALYEPPLSINHSTPMDWLGRYDRELAQGRLGSAVVTAMRGTQMAPALLRFMPRLLLDGPLNFAARRGGKDNEEVPLKALVPTMHYDAQLVLGSEGSLDSFRGVKAEVLLLGGTKSPRYLKTSLDALSSVLPNARRVEFPGFDHLAPDNSGEPERVAEELRSFFA